MCIEIFFYIVYFFLIYSFGNRGCSLVKKVFVMWVWDYEFNFKINIKKLGVVVYVCVFCIGEVEIEGFLRFIG